MGFSVEASVPAITVFLQGLFSFLSPCVLPLVPLYIGYLAGGTKRVDPDGNIYYPKKKVMVNTLFFVIGISFAFFLLGFGFTAAGRFFNGNKVLFSTIGGVLVILFGLYQLGIFGAHFQKEHRLPFKWNSLAMNPLLAFVLGFTFSFAWTPCVGPALASVLLMASSVGSSVAGFALIGVYTLGFVLPFLAIGLFTTTLLDFFKRHQAVVKYTVKIGGALMVLMGVMMITGWMNGVTSYLSKISGNDQANTAKVSEETHPKKVAEGQEKSSAAPSKADKENSEGNSESSSTIEESSAEEKKIPAIDFTLTDQNGSQHTLSEYKGKTVFLNFWATWCPPCQKEMPDIQALYEQYGGNANDLIILGIANPKTEKSPYNQDGSIEEVTKFLSDNGYTYPVVMDTTGRIFSEYGITSFPTTFMIDKDGNVFGYVTGQLDRTVMENIIKQTMEGKK